MAGTSIDLGTVYATAQLGLTQVQAGLDALKEQLAQVQGILNDFVASLGEVSGAFDDATEPVAALDDALDAGSVAFQALADAADEADGALASVGAAVDDASASVDATSAAVDANTAALDRNTEALKANAVGHKAATDASTGLGASLGKLVAPAAIAEAAVVGLAAVAVKLSSDFSASMTQLVTGAGESVSNLKLVSNGILAMASQTGESTTQLAQAMFTIESAGDHGAKGLTILRDAAESSRESGAQLADTANALTTVLANYGNQGVTAANATNILLGIVSNGKTTMQALASSISTVLPAAAKYGVSLTDVGAALATMTAQNGDAASSTTYLRQLLTSLASPSAASQKALASIGLSAQQVSDDMKKSLPDTLQLITDRINSTFPPGSVAATTAFKDIAGGARQMQGMLLLTGQSMGTFKQNVVNVSDAVKQGGNTIAGWSLTQKDLSTQLAQTGAAAQVALIQVGTALEPIVKQVISNVMPALKQFGDWASTHGPEIAHAFEIAAAAIGVVLVVALAAATTTFIMATAAAIGIVSALALLTAGIAVVVTHWQDIIRFFTDGNPVITALEAAVAGVGAAFLAFGITQIPALISAIPGVIASLGTMAAGWWADATAAGAAAIATLAAAAPFIAVGAAVALVTFGIIELIQHWSQVKAFFENLGKTIGGFFSGLGSHVQAGLAAAGASIGGWFSSLGTGAQRAVESVGGWFSSLGTMIHARIMLFLEQLKLDWAMIPVLFQAGLRAAEQIVQDAIETVVGWFVWLFNHNYYFHDLVVGIQREFTFIRDVVTTIWNAITGFLTRAWNGDVALARTLWHDLTTGIQIELAAAQAIISAVWTVVSAFVMGVLTKLVSWLKVEWAAITAEAQAAWQLFQASIVQPVQNAWNRVTALVGGWAGWLRDKWTQIVGDVTAWWGQMTGKVEAGGKAAADKVTSSFITPITSAITGIITQALAWGENLMKMLGQGIANGAGGIKQAATNALGGLGRILGFHSPAAEGPGADADTWAPNLMTMFAAGLAASGPLLAQAAASALLGVRAALTSGGAGSASLTSNVSLPVNSPASGALREAIASMMSGVGASTGAALLGASGPAAVAGGDTYYLTVEVVAAPSDGEPYQAGVAFGNGFASGFQQARTQRGL